MPFVNSVMLLKKPGSYQYTEEKIYNESVKDTYIKVSR